MNLDREEDRVREKGDMEDRKREKKKIRERERVSDRLNGP